MPDTSSNPQPKRVYEWVLTMNKGDEVILTEHQYEFYRDQVQSGDLRKVFFNEVELNPPFVVSSFRRPAEYIKNKYPCRKCYSSGKMPDHSFCDNCGGSGVDLPA